MMLLMILLFAQCDASFWSSFISSVDDPSWKVCDTKNGTIIPVCICPGQERSMNDVTLDCRSQEINVTRDGMLIPPEVTQIDLSMNKIPYINLTTFHRPLTNVRKLDISNNSLIELKEYTFLNFINLNRLILRGNQISSIDELALSGLGNLQSLDLGDNKLGSLPSSLFDPLSKLDLLHLKNNPIKDLPPNIFGKLLALSFLDISNLQLLTLNKGLFSNNRISRLDLSRNLFTEVPTDALRQIKDHLRIVSLSNTQIETLNDTSFSGLINLETIYLNEMPQLRRISQFTFQKMSFLNIVRMEKLPKLKKLDPKAFYISEHSREKCPINDFNLTETSLNHIDKRLLNWDQISELNLSGNLWTCDCKMSWLIESPIGKGFKCENPPKLKGELLQDLTPEQLVCPKAPVTRNKTTIPGDGYSLCDPSTACNCPTLSDINYSKIDCSDMQITHIDDHMIIPKMYESIDFSQNNIKYLNNETFYDIENRVTSVDFSSNSLDVFREATFMNLNKLEHLDLYNNRLYDLNALTFKGLDKLKFLDLHFNKLYHLPEEIFDPLINLEELYLGYNPLTSVSGRLFSKLINLVKLDLSYLKLKSIHPDMFKNLRLINLNLDHNSLTSVPIESLHLVKSTLKILTLSGNPIEKLDVESFTGLEELHEINFEQMLKLKDVGPYSFSKLNKLETIIFMYMPKIKRLDKKAFHLSMSDNATCPIRDLTFAFTVLTTLDEELLQWDKLNYINLKNNRWNCDCHLSWIKGSIVENFVGDQIYCIKPLRLQGENLKRIDRSSLTCGIDVRDHATATLTYVMTLLSVGILISLCTVGYLSYKRNGWLLRRPMKPQFNYGRLDEDRASVITVEGEL